MLIQRGFIKGIIGLPANLFYGTGIPACILVIDKQNAHVRKGVFMMDASQGFIKDGNKNRLRAQDIHKIVSIFNAQTEIDRYARMVPTAEIADPANDYNLNIPRYIDTSEPEDLHDLNAHLNGGIPNRDIDALDNYWQVFPTLRDVLFTPASEEAETLPPLIRGAGGLSPASEEAETLPPLIRGAGGLSPTNKAGRYSHARVEPQQIKTTLLSHNAFIAYQERVTTRFDAWWTTHESHLRSIGDAPPSNAGSITTATTSRRGEVASPDHPSADSTITATMPRRGEVASPDHPSADSTTTATMPRRGEVASSDHPSAGSITTATMPRRGEVASPDHLSADSINTPPICVK